MTRRRFSPEPQMDRLPTPPAPAPKPGTFCLMPLPLPATSPVALAVAQLYQAAFEQAQAVARPSIIERDVLGVWN